MTGSAADIRTDLAIGLTRGEASARLRADGPNALPDPERRSVLKIVTEVLREPMFALLVAGGAVYLAIGDVKEALVLIAFALLSVAIAVVQGVRSERVLDALRDLTQPHATVIRDGARQRIASAELVRGDVIAIAEGERAPADALLRQGEEVQADESLLTGESAPVRKQPAGSGDPAPEGLEDPRRIFSGTLIVRGQGLAEVTATGPRSEIGRIGGALHHLSTPPTRLARETGRIVRTVGLFAFVVCGAVVLLFGLVRGSWLQGLLGGIALGMAMLPEEFPLILSVFMVMGAWRISRAKVLTRRPAAIETLGSATVLCTDKTGTLTQNRMVLARAWTSEGLARWEPGEAPPEWAHAAIRAGILASAPHPFDPMERAFHDAGRGWSALPESWVLERAFGLTASRLAVVNVWRDAALGHRQAWAKGAPETVIRLCRLDKAASDEVLRAVEAMAADGIRVLAAAEAPLASSDLPETPDGLPFVFLGLIGLMDPLRPDVPEAAALCRAAGVRVIMITGDYPATARAIARDAGLAHASVLAGDELAALSDAQLADCIEGVDLFARIRPEQKLRIVQALQANGEVVAMTGDGVNDAPALKASDIGVAMGGRGTDVAREASSLILLDDDFGSIVRAMRLGRRIYDNMKKAMGFVLAVHVPIAGLALLPLVFGLPVLLAPAHIALLEMIIDPVCSVAFEAEPEEPDIMRRPPRDPKSPIFTRAGVITSLVQGAVLLAVVSALYLWGLRDRLHASEVRTVSFLALALGVFALVHVNRALHGGHRPPNRAFLTVMAIVAAVIGLAVAFPWTRELFAFEALTPVGISMALAAGAASLALLALTTRLGASARAPSAKEPVS
jgi:Ca2+-transporting ATPase